MVVSCHRLTLRKGLLPDSLGLLALLGRFVLGCWIEFSFARWCINAILFTIAYSANGRQFPFYIDFLQDACLQAWSPFRLHNVCILEFFAILVIQMIIKCLAWAATLPWLWVRNILMLILIDKILLKSVFKFWFQLVIKLCQRTTLIKHFGVLVAGPQLRRAHWILLVLLRLLFILLLETSHMLLNPWLKRRLLNLRHGHKALFLQLELLSRSIQLIFVDLMYVFEVVMTTLLSMCQQARQFLSWRILWSAESTRAIATVREAFHHLWEARRSVSGRRYRLVWLSQLRNHPERWDPIPISYTLTLWGVNSFDLLRVW